MSLIDSLFHPHRWTVAAPVFTDFLFPVNKRNSLLACKAPAQQHCLSSCVMWGYLQFPEQYIPSPSAPLFPPSPPSLPGEPPVSHRAAQVPVCPVGSLILPTYLYSLGQCLSQVPVLAPLIEHSFHRLASWFRSRPGVASHGGASGLPRTGAW